MSRIDWDTMLAGLEQQRTGLEQELADVDAVIDAVKQRTRTPLSLRPARATAAKKPAKNGHAKKATPANGIADRDTLKAQAKVLYEKGEVIEEIAKAVGKSSVTVYGWASAGGWKRPAAD